MDPRSAAPSHRPQAPPSRFARAPRLIEKSAAGIRRLGRRDSSASRNAYAVTRSPWLDGDVRHAPGSPVHFLAARASRAVREARSIMKTRRAVVGGLIGGLALSAFGAVARATGIPVQLELLLGTIIVPTAGATAVVVGFAAHLAVSIAIALLYAAGFERWARRGGWTVGLAFSLVHTAISGAVIGLVPYVHPRVPGMLPAPGPYLAHLGAVAIGCSVLMHAVYGIIVGAVYGDVESEPRAVGQPDESTKVGRIAAAPENDAGSDEGDADLDTREGRRRASRVAQKGGAS